MKMQLGRFFVCVCVFMVVVGKFNRSASAIQERKVNNLGYRNSPLQPSGHVPLVLIFREGLKWLKLFS